MARFGFGFGSVRQKRAFNPLAPASTVAPSITPSTGDVGTVFTLSNGTWTNTPTFTRQWYNAAGLIPGATATTYTAVTGDRAGSIYGIVTATANSTSAAAASNSVAIPALAPTNAIVPTLSGTTTEGQMLSSTAGTWNNIPTAYAYQWKRAGVNIGGATASTYLLVTADVGKVITCAVTASNTAGSNTATSAGSAAIAGLPVAPSNTVAPAITGTAQDGQTLTVSNGTWSGTPAPTYAYQWKRGGTNVGTNAATYLVATADVGSTITCTVTATNTAGSALAMSAATAVVSPAPAGALKIALAGSSTPEKFKTEYVGTSNARVSSSTDGTTFAAVTVGALVMEAGHQIATALNRDVKWLTMGVGGSTVSQWMSASDVRFTACRDAIIAAGGVDMLFFQCGWNDAAAKTVTSQASHAANLRTTLANIRSGVGLPNLKIIIGLSQKGNPGNHDATGMAQLVLVRAAEQDVATDTNNCLGYSPMDLATADGIHQTQASQLTSAGRLVPNFLAVLAGTTVYSGPIATSSTAVDSTHTDITFTNPNGTDITPTSGITGASITLSDTTTPAITAAVRQSANVVRLTHASLGGLAGTVSYLALGAPDMSGAVFDNGTPVRPSLPTRAPLAFSATAPVLQVLSITPNTATSGTGYTGTIAGKTSGSTITATASDGTTLNVSGVTVTGTFSTTGSKTVSLVETLAGATGSPKTTSGLAVTVSAPSVAKSANIDPSFSTLPVPAGWNRWNGAVGSDNTSTPGILPADLTTILTPAGVTTGWSVKMVSADRMQCFSTALGASTGNNSGVFPDQVMQSTWYSDFTATAGHDMTVRISGLDNAKLYTIGVRGSRAASRAPFDVVIGAASQSMDPTNNTSTVLTFANIAPSSGSIDFICRQQGLTPAFLDAFTITEQ
ncbi:SGNH/GDSL hydrolase family protein [Sphingomonas paeninsulae]|uniref:SGNH/GDSL hydrolase family protein n=1 Tax=Sphingomonas paeninsulae TaxID=2319844 RepID=A0A494T8W2_SPHPE|nr:SGNH/GDSL hydrolase family protein [Sphingomonas paeninsulae]AYJ85789.1 SGNH/GDSL hydrolase family protein [Sphingomonas paeninsulae]